MWDTESQWLSIARRICLEHGNPFIGIWNASSLSDPYMNQLTQTYESCLCEELTPGSRKFIEKSIVVHLVKILSSLCGTRRGIVLFTSSRFWITSWARWIYSAPSHSSTLRFILILSSYLRPGLVMVSSSHVFHFKFYALKVYCARYCLHPIFLYLISRSFIFDWKPPIMKLIIMYFSPSPCYFTTLFPNTEWTPQLFFELQM